MTELTELFIKEGIPYILKKLPKCSSCSSRSSEMASWKPHLFKKDLSSVGKQPVSPPKRQLPYKIAQIFVIFCVFYQNWVTSEESTMSLKPSVPTTWPFAVSVLCKFFQAKGVVQLLPSPPRWVQCWLATVQPASSCVESVGVFHFSSTLPREQVCILILFVLLFLLVCKENMSQFFIGFRNIVSQHQNFSHGSLSFSKAKGNKADKNT